VLYEPIVTAWLRTDLPGDVALWDWDRMIVVEVVRGVSTGDPAGGIAASVTAWNEIPWSDLPSAVRTPPDCLRRTTFGRSVRGIVS